MQVKLKDASWSTSGTPGLWRAKHVPRPPEFQCWESDISWAQACMTFVLAGTIPTLPLPNICGGFHCPNVGDQAQDWFGLARLLSDRKQFCGYLCTALRLGGERDSLGDRETLPLGIRQFCLQTFVHLQYLSFRIASTPPGDFRSSPMDFLPRLTWVRA